MGVRRSGCCQSYSAASAWRAIRPSSSARRCRQIASSRAVSPPCAGSTGSSEASSVARRSRRSRSSFTVSVRGCWWAMLEKIVSMSANASRLFSEEKPTAVSVRSRALDGADEGQAAHLPGVVHAVADEITRRRIPRPGVESLGRCLRFARKRRRSEPRMPPSPSDGTGRRRWSGRCRTRRRSAARPCLQHYARYPPAPRSGRS